MARSSLPSEVRTAQAAAGTSIPLHRLVRDVDATLRDEDGARNLAPASMQECRNGKRCLLVRMLCVACACERFRVSLLKHVCLCLPVPVSAYLCRSPPACTYMCLACAGMFLCGLFRSTVRSVAMRPYL
eukprot:6195785-Pleurochrysis_carterae.AAC.3